MITVVAVVPTTPLALQGVPGRRHDGIAVIAAAARRVTRDLAGVDLVVAVAGGVAPAVLAPPGTDLTGYGLHLPAHRLPPPGHSLAEGLREAITGGERGVPGFGATPSPVTQAPQSGDQGGGPDLAVLARWAPADVPCIGVAVPADAPPTMVEAVAAAVVTLAADRRVGVLVAGDLGAGHGPKPPRPDAAAASRLVQDLVVAALDNGRPADLVRLDPAVEAASGARGVGALRVLGHILGRVRIGTIVRASATPLGVGYVVAQGG